MVQENTIRLLFVDCMHAWMRSELEFRHIVCSVQGLRHILWHWAQLVASCFIHITVVAFLVVVRPLVAFRFLAHLRNLISKFHFYQIPLVILDTHLHLVYANQVD